MLDEKQINRWLEEQPDEAWQAGYLDETIDQMKQLLNDYLEAGPDKSLRREMQREGQRKKSPSG